MKIRNIERGIANPPLYAFLGWPSSYQSKVLFRYYTYVSTNGASPRWADARLGCARARNFRGNRQIEAVNATLVRYCQGFIKNKSRLNEDKENTGIRFNESATKLAIRHTMANSSSNNSSIATHRAAAADPAAVAALCMQIKLTSRLLRRHLS